MKVANQVHLPILILLLTSLAVVSCKKNGIDSTASDSLPATPITALAGSDKSFQLPLDFFLLEGSFLSQRPLSSGHWRKLSGPSCIIDNPNNLTTKVRGIQTGVYQFELTVFDISNLAGKDTVNITVNRQTDNIDVGQKFVVFSSLTWIFPWYSALEVKNINAYIPQGVPLRVYVQRGTAANWIQAHPVSTDNNNNTYEYFIETRPDGAGMYNFGSLYVFFYGSDTNDRPKVKVEFD